MSAFSLLEYCARYPQATQSKALNILFKQELIHAEQPSERDWQGDFAAGYRTVMQRSRTLPYVLTSFCTCPSDQPVCKHAVALMMYFSMVDAPRGRFPEDAVVARWMAVKTEDKVAGSRGIGRDAQEYEEQHVLSLGWQAMTDAEFELNNSGPDFAGQLAVGIIWFIQEKWPLILSHGYGLELLNHYAAFLRAVAAYPAAKRETLNRFCQHLLSVGFPELDHVAKLKETLKPFIAE